MTPEARMMQRIASHPKPFTPVIGNVYIEVAGHMVTIGERQRITVIKGDGGTHVYMWGDRRVHHMQGAEREFVLFGSSVYNR